MDLLKFLSFLFIILVGFISSKSSAATIIKHTFEVYYFPGAPDGVYKEKILGINGQSPGPTIEAFVGDTLEVTVLNKIQDKQNVTIHWHGIHQKGSIFEDGTSQVTQCPLPYGSFQVYTFNLTQAGTYWYHSHVRSQYTEGLLGALIVHNQNEPYQYDGEITLILSDWYHRTSHENEEWYLSPISLGVSPYPDSTLINGLGRYPCEYADLQNRSCSAEDQRRQVFTIPMNSTVRVRIINAGAITFMNFTIDGHKLETIEVDGVDLAKPVLADVVSLTPGQSYSFLLRPPPPSLQKATMEEGEMSFLMRSIVRKDRFKQGDNINKYPEALYDQVTAVLKRVPLQNNSMMIHHKLSTEVFSHRERISPSPSKSSPNEEIIYLNDMDLLPLSGELAPDYFDKEFVLVTTLLPDASGMYKEAFNATPFDLPDDKPVLMSLLDEGRVPNSAIPLEVPANSVVQIVIRTPNGAHPFHLHGHHFWIVGLGKELDGPYDPSKHNLTTKAPLRNTVTVEGDSYAVLRFVANNPGMWLFHCHLDWHNLSGMIATIVEAPEILIQEVKQTEEAKRICGLHGR